MNVILQIPLQAPVIRRELANKMYSPTSAFIGRYLSTMCIQIIYPIILLLILFWLIGIDTSLENMFYLFSFGILGNFTFCGQGYFMGIVVPNDDAVKAFNGLTTMFWTMSNGVLSNLNEGNWFILFLRKISPLRYINEGIFRRMTNQIPDLTNAYPPLNVNQDTILK